VKNPQVTRRRLIGVAGATGVAAVLGGVALPRGSVISRAIAQEDPEATPTPLGPAIPEEFNTETNWPYENLNLNATREAKATKIGTDSVGTLGDAWQFKVDAAAFFGALTSNPTIVGDTVYIQDASANVYALNKDTGEQVWVNTYNDTVPSGGPNGTANAYGLVFTTLGGVGDVLALRADTGEEVWRTNILGPKNEGITTAPLVYDNVVYVSTIPGSSEGFYIGGQRGVIHALDAGTGQVLWYFDTTTDNLWGNPTVNSGGGFWHPPSVDEEGMLYVPVANPAPYPGAEGWPWASSRPGDNLYTDSILKMDPKTATLDWYYQVKPHDVFDLDNQLTPILADIDSRKVVFTSGKHGVVYALDRDTGELIWRTPVGTHQNDERTEFEVDEKVVVSPGTLGGVETQFAYAEEPGLLICPVVELPSHYVGTGFDPDAGFDFSVSKGLLVALNVSDGTVAWQVELPTAPYAAATITNDVVFTGGLDGIFYGFKVADGSEVFRYQATAGVNAPPAVSGDFIYLPAGGPLLPSDANPNPSQDVVQQLIALKLGGEVQPAPSPGAATPEGEATPPEESAISPSESEGTPTPSS
jgi:outer membrane protein assembly factor BamB